MIHAEFVRWFGEDIAGLPPGLISRGTGRGCPSSTSFFPSHLFTLK
jgi:hypothetical protein